MTATVPDALKPRKLPRQARSRATIDAILDAAIQVLLAVGPRRMNTTRVAERAGVSVGTVYQYFPHKQALLYAVVQRYLDEVADAVETCATAHLGRPLAIVSDALVTAYIDAKAARPDVALALYQASSEMDVASLVHDTFVRIHATAVRLLSSAPDARIDKIEDVAFTFVAALSGATRIAFENDVSSEALLRFREQVRSLCRGYLGCARKMAVPEQTP